MPGFFRAAVGFAVLATVGGCAGTLADLQGTRTATVNWNTISSDVGPVVLTPGGVLECTSNFELRNSGWGSVRIESARVPISTVILTDPPLPATVKAGQTLSVIVVSKVRPGTTMKPRTIQLETTGQPPVVLTVSPAAGAEQVPNT